MSDWQSCNRNFTGVDNPKAFPSGCSGSMSVQQCLQALSCWQVGKAFLQRPVLAPVLSAEADMQTSHPAGLPSSSRCRARQASFLRQQATLEHMQAVINQQLWRTRSRSLRPLLCVQRHATVPASSRRQAAAVRSQAGAPTWPLRISRKSSSLPVPHPRSASSVRPCSASRLATRVWRSTDRGGANRASLVDTGAGYLQTDSDGDLVQNLPAHRASL